MESAYVREGYKYISLHISRTPGNTGPCLGEAVSGPHHTTAAVQSPVREYTSKKFPPKSIAPRLSYVADPNSVSARLPRDRILRRVAPLKRGADDAPLEEPSITVDLGGGVGLGNREEAVQKRVRYRCASRRRAGPWRTPSRSRCCRPCPHSLISLHFSPKPIAWRA